MRVKMSMLYDGLKSCILCKKGSSYNKSVPVDDVCFSKKAKFPVMSATSLSTGAIMTNLPTSTSPPKC